MSGFRGFAWGRISGPAVWSAAAWTVAITADDANDTVTVTGAVGVNIRWHAVVQGSEVVY